MTPLQQQLRKLFPGEDIQVTVTRKRRRCPAGCRATPIMLKAGEIAEKTSAKTKVINLLQVPGGIESQQVMLQVRFAEVNRQALHRSRASRCSPAPRLQGLGGADHDAAVRRADFARRDELTFSDFLNLFVFNTKYNVGALMQGAPDQRACSRAWPSRT